NVDNIVLDFFPHGDAAYATIDATPVRITIQRLAPGRRVSLGLPETYGIPRIRATATCGSASPVVDIVATRQDFNGDGAPEYAAFCRKAPDGGADYQPQLRFYTDPATNRNVIFLDAKSSWDAYWDVNPKLGGPFYFP